MTDPTPRDYGNLDAIKRMLAATGTTWDANAEARLSDLNTAISRLLEDELGRTFGTPGADVSRVVRAKIGEQLVLPVPMWSVSEILVGGSMAGPDWSGGSALDAAAWTPCITDYSGQIYALNLYGGVWGEGAAVQVTGQWADTDTDDVPPVDLIMAANILVVETYKMQNVPIVTDDGILVPRRDPWLDPFVRKVIERYQISTRELVV